MDVAFELALIRPVDPALGGRRSPAHWRGGRSAA
jgi:hypothetical protein